MADPLVIPALVTSMVTALSAYMTYRVELRKAEKVGKEMPPKSNEVVEGEVIARKIDKAITDVNDEAALAALAYVEKVPQQRQVLEAALAKLYKESSTFREALSMIAKEVGLHSSESSVQINIEGSTVGNSAAINYGTQSASIGLKSDDQTL